MGKASLNRERRTKAIQAVHVVGNYNSFPSVPYHHLQVVNEDEKEWMELVAIPQAVGGDEEGEEKRHHQQPG